MCSGRLAIGQSLVGQKVASEICFLAAMRKDLESGWADGVWPGRETGGVGSTASVGEEKRRKKNGAILEISVATRRFRHMRDAHVPVRSLLRPSSLPIARSPSARSHSHSHSHSLSLFFLVGNRPTAARRIDSA
jgi:hypothetical protein